MNQNPDVAVTANSPISIMIDNLSTLYNTDIFNNFPDSKSLDNVIGNIIPNYYKGWKAKYIIDRQAWGHESLLTQLKYHLTNDIKIIVLVRPIAEVLASFIRISKTSDDNYLVRHGDSVEDQCDFLMEDNGMIDVQLRSMKNLLKSENRGLCHFIDYDDLVNNTHEELDKTYEFLNIPKYNHKLNNLKQVSHNNIRYNDDIHGMKIHTIKTKSVEKSNYKVEDYLPKNIIEKCNNFNFWEDR